MSFAEQMSRIDLDPTDGQKAAGNYRKGHIRVHGLDITIENPRGSYRVGVGSNGKKWRSRLPNHYGYIRNTEGGDGDHVDTYIGPHLKAAKVYVIDQHHLGGGGWDEHKCFIGFGSQKQAEQAYCRAFSDGRGMARIGHIAAMDVDKFKDWLKSGRTRHAVKRRAAGGGVQDDGPPPYEPSGAPPYEPPVEGPGKLEAAGYGAAAGATFNMADEIAGARAASPKLPGGLNVPEFVGPVPARTIAGAARTAAGYMFPPDKKLSNLVTGEDPKAEAVQQYEKARDEYRAGDKAAEEAHPWIHTGAEIAGGIPAMAAMPEAGFAKLPQYGRGLAKAAQSAAEYGGLSGAGEGEGVADRALKGATGIVSGIVGGPVGKMAGDVAGYAANKVAGPVVQTVRGWFNNEGEAARRVATALRADQDLVASGKATGLSPQQWAAARANGEPVTLADLGSANTQALLRSAANTSPEARAQLEKVIEGRFLNQNERLADTVRQAIPGSSGNARKTADQMVAEYDAGRVPAYRKAYQQGDKPLMSPAMERLMSSDTFVGAMKRAISTGKDRDVAEGLGGFNPMVNVTPDGRIVFNKGANGVPTYPNLQYWDQVKRELDDVATKAQRSGAKGEADVAGRMATILRDELDHQVPTYAKARGIAADFFGERDALQAGRKLAGKNVPPEEVKALMRKMKPDERALFQEGYASDLAERVIGGMKDTTNVVKGRGMFQSPNERKLASAIFGPGGMAMLQARMHLETIMDGARQAMGNSTTARQLIEAGLAGGALSGYASGWDPTETIKGAGAFVAARGAPSVITKVLPQVAESARHVIGKVDSKTAAKVAELLTSNDPRLLRQGYQMAAKSEAIMSGLKKIANRVALSGQSQARGPVDQGFRALQGPMGARADEEQQRP
jgi:hypothetical protein